MITEIQRFCETFADDLKPFSERLDQALSDIRLFGDVEALRTTGPLVSEVRHSLKTLSDKIESQQAYLLIFGPLKSGKSTLMNALAGSYVSEVSSLPAYPCLVYVHHGEKEAYAITNYNGLRYEFGSNLEMQKKIDADHGSLAEHIVEVEKRGELFDPSVHFPEAIRRIDITLPAESLKASGTVLVDTPGLYSRMKFGYDLMTREFRNFAACAVFVVKTDNLFLEQVFDEFNDLLGYFSRIFLIVNIDTSKRDLAPDGTLKPSLERESPERIIEAFKSLTMNASLRDAYEEGRLRIYPVDLLRSAAERLREPGHVNGETTEELAPVEGQGYEAFISDLTDYLNSSDYLHEFMLDSLRQGKQLSEEIRRISADEDLELYTRQDAEARESLTTMDAKLDAARVLRKGNLVQPIDPETIHALDVIEEEKSRLAEKLARPLHEGLSSWYEGDDTLDRLQSSYLNQLIQHEEEPSYDRLIRKTKFLVDSADGGVSLTPESEKALHRLEFSLDALIRDSFRHFASEVPQPNLRLYLDTSRIPVRKNFWDYVFFRSQTQVNRNFLGENLEKKIPSAIKQKRLSGSAKQHLDETIDQHLTKEIPARLHSYLLAVLKHHVERVKRHLEEKLNKTESDLATRRKETEASLAEIEKILRVLRQLHEASVDFGSKVDQLRETYAGETTPAVEEEPATPEAESEATVESRA